MGEEDEHRDEVGEEGRREQGPALSASTAAATAVVVVVVEGGELEMEAKSMAL